MGQKVSKEMLKKEKAIISPKAMEILEILDGMTINEVRKELYTIETIFKLSSSNAEKVTKFKADDRYLFLKQFDHTSQE